MLAAAVVLVAAAALAGIIAFAGGGLFALIVLPIGIGLAIWLAVSGASERGGTEVANDPGKPELLGPGRQDDADA